MLRKRAYSPEVAVSLPELESAVSQLPTDELTAFARWFEEYLADAWDRRIEETSWRDDWTKQVAARMPISRRDDASRYEPLRHARFLVLRHLSAEVQDLADKNFPLLRQDPHHPSLRLKKVGFFWSARVGLHYRVLARDRKAGCGSGLVTIASTIRYSRGRRNRRTIRRVGLESTVRPRGRPRKSINEA